MPTSSSRTGSKIVMEGLTFDDLLLLPNYTSFPREQANLETKLHPTITLKLPIISSPMDTVTETQMAIAMAQSGGLGVIHRNLQVATQRKMVEDVKRAEVRGQRSEGSDQRTASLDSKGRYLVGAAVGAGADLEERVKALVDAGVDLIVVDSGHGHSQYIMDAVTFIKKHNKKTVVMAGNVATYDGAKAMMKAGADILRVGVGPGSICTTRVVTGMGVPQVTALMEVARAVKGTKVTFVADGGIRQMGDMAKALATGASAVMLGSMLAGYEQSPGEKVTKNGKAFKRYRGMGSIGAMQKGGAERYGQSMKTEAKKLIAEGVEGLVPFKGDVHDFLYQAAGALRSSFYYLGSKSMKEFHAKAKFVKITQASLQESHPHTVSISDAGGSYMV
ncbi:MAG TPA: IMP dehydrogenase [Candidatus Peribacteraceae bacterium]|nr:IMP dehydrogenase [Candidatus Peribacteraceae bacterium]